MIEREIYDQDGNLLRTEKVRSMKNMTVTERVHKINPKFNPNLTYVPRSQRPEWHPVGLLGMVILNKGQPTNSNWIKLRDLTETTEEWLIK